MLNLKAPGRIELFAYCTLLIGALGDWTTTTLGLARGFVEGNSIASSLMNAELWIPVDLLVVGICILIPYVINRLIQSKAANLFYAFPLLAGVLKIGVSLWNLNLILR